MENADGQALAALRSQLIERLPPSAEFPGIEKHRLLARSFHRLARLPQRDPDARQGRAWAIFFAEYVPHLGPHGPLLWKDWRTPLLKDDAPGPHVIIGQREPDAHCATFDGDKLFVDLESAITDFITALDALLARCENDDDLRATVLHNWRATQWTVQAFTGYTASATPVAVTSGTVPVAGIPSVVSASASASFATRPTTETVCTTAERPSPVRRRSRAPR
jgi:hypothetical protein